MASTPGTCPLSFLEARGFEGVCRAAVALRALSKELPVLPALCHGHSLPAAASPHLLLEGMSWDGQTALREQMTRLDQPRPNKVGVSKKNKWPCLFPRQLYSHDLRSEHREASEGSLTSSTPGERQVLMGSDQ